ncbi:MAG: glycogen debranching enzyme GlgX, partial [Alphaproteobacteria bacterium]|nr:glycogen debranching enzyme GlgX [Alphaproteobacteria bacterium]
GNSQGGNNNAYCQDNPIGWVDWSALAHHGEDMTALVAQLTELRRRFRQLRPARWVEGRRPDRSFGVLWLTPQATEMKDADWNFPGGRFLSYVLSAVEPGGLPLYVVLNAAADAISFKFPELPPYGHWSLLLETAPEPRNGQRFACGATLQAPARSVLAFAGAP